MNRLSEKGGPRKVRCIENVWIPMKDGVRLAGRVLLPDDAEDHPVPALLEYIPYRKRDHTRLPDEATHPYLAVYPLELARGAMLYKLGNYQESEALLRRWTMAHPDDMRARNWMLAAMAKNHPEY